MILTEPIIPYNTLTPSLPSDLLSLAAARSLSKEGDAEASERKKGMRTPDSGGRMTKEKEKVKPQPK